VPGENELGDDRRSVSVLDAELAAMRAQVAHLRSENTRLLRLLDLTPAQARPRAGADGDFRRGTRLSARRFVAGDEGRVLRRSVQCSNRCLCGAVGEPHTIDIPNFQALRAPRPEQGSR
jgi:hypothetical protein